MNAWDVIGILLLLLSGVAVVVAGLIQEVRYRGYHLTAPRQRAGFSSSSGSASACFLLLPSCWLAIKSRDVVAVQTALGLHQVRPCSWMEGLTNADRLFVAPPIKGWILVTGSGLPTPDEDVDTCFRFVSDLSRKLGTVEFFSAERHSHHHAWVKAKDGQVLRAYAWAGRTLWTQGTPTRAEKELQVKCFEYTEPTSDLPPGQADALEANVRKVPLLAARWGLDPARIQGHLLLEEHGIAGKPAHRY